MKITRIEKATIVYGTFSDGRSFKIELHENYAMLDVDWETENCKHFTVYDVGQDDLLMMTYLKPNDGYKCNFSAFYHSVDNYFSYDKLRVTEEAAICELLDCCEHMSDELVKLTAAQQQAEQLKSLVNLITNR